MDYLSVFMLALHIVCAAALVGGAMVWRIAANSGSGDNTLAAAWRPIAFSAIGGVLLSGVYNLMHRPIQTKQFHMLFGIKMLLVLHIFAVTVLATKPDNPRRSRQLTGIVISGIVVLIISAAFRWV